MSVFFFMINWHIYIWKLGEVEFICYIGLDDWLIAVYEWMPWVKPLSHVDAIKLLVHSNQVMFQISLQAGLILNTFLSLDLIWSNQDPLKPSRKRMQLYYIITLILVFINCFITSSFLPTPKEKVDMFYIPKDSDTATHKLGDMLASN
jgi:hypothetical protein